MALFEDWAKTWLLPYIPAYSHEILKHSILCMHLSDHAQVEIRIDSRLMQQVLQAEPASRDQTGVVAARTLIRDGAFFEEEKQGFRYYDLWARMQVA